MLWFPIKATFRIVSSTFLPFRFDVETYKLPVLKVLRSACQTQPPPATVFTIPPSQIFTLTPPATYPTSLTPATLSHGLPHSGVIAIAVVIPLVIIIFLLSFAIYWYKRYQKADATPRYPHPVPEFDFSDHHGDLTSTETPQAAYSPYPYPDPLQSQFKGKQRSEMVESPIPSPFTPPPPSIREEDEEDGHQEQGLGLRLDHRSHGAA